MKNLFRLFVRATLPTFAIGVIQISPVNANRSESFGLVRGTLNYPSNYIPDMKVCAVNIDTLQEICIKTPQNPENNAFSMRIPVGFYWFYASDSQMPIDTPATGRGGFLLH